MSASNGQQKIVVGLGELLWDMLPDGPRLGGAPANFGVMAGRLGDHAVIASRVGSDRLGRQARAELNALPVDTSWLQLDEDHATGTVTVVLDYGEPHYTFQEPVAWDRMELTPEWLALARSADAVCFGTLAQRDAQSRETILGFLDATRADCVRIADVNLRAPFWSGEVLRQSLQRATVLKLNIHEMPEVLRATRICAQAAMPNHDDEILHGARQLLECYPLQLVCVTIGSEGSMLVTREESHRHRGRPVVVRDTVGAGDAFTAALTHYYLEGAPLAVLNEAGNRWGAWMASQRGAMPPMRADMVRDMTEEIRLLSA
jgi:fructokinase